MNNAEKFVTTDLLPAFFVGQWVSVVEDITNIIVYVLVSVLRKVILSIIEKNKKHEYILLVSDKTFLENKKLGLVPFGGISPFWLFWFYHKLL